MPESDDKEPDTYFPAKEVSADEARDNDEALRRDHSSGEESPHIPPTTAEHMRALTTEELALVGEQLESPDISDFSVASPEELDALRGAYEGELSRQVGQLLDESGMGSQAGVQGSSQQEGEKQDLSEEQPVINEQQDSGITLVEFMDNYGMGSQAGVQGSSQQDLSEKEQPVINEQQPEVAEIPPKVTAFQKEPRTAKKRNRIQKSKIAEAPPLMEEGLREKT